LHEFLPRREDLMVEIATLPYAGGKEKKTLVERYSDYGAKSVGDLKQLLPTLLARVEQLHEFNPMLGHRGCRLGITYPEITEMQARGIFEAAVEVAKKGVKVIPEVMIPLVATVKEMANQAAIVRRVAEEVFKEKGTKIEYMVGTMIELPRAALVADEIAKEAEGILKQDPFAALDQEGVGQLVKLATERGRKTRPTLKVGICGEHGGEPSSVEFCYRTGLNYVSCSPFRVLTARLAAAQAAATETLKVEGERTK
jgi:pyruvate,orthophosphate dikinase